MRSRRVALVAALLIVSPLLVLAASRIYRWTVRYEQYAALAREYYLITKKHPLESITCPNISLPIDRAGVTLPSSWDCEILDQDSSYVRIRAEDGSREYIVSVSPLADGLLGTAFHNHICSIGT